jgi:hypothetical protein
MPVVPKALRVQTSRPVKTAVADELRTVLTTVHLVPTAATTFVRRA